MEKIVPCLWFDTQAEEAVAFYTSVFPNSRVLDVYYYGEGAPRPADMVLTITSELNGREFMALNGGPEYTFTPAISLAINCASQAEIDTLWTALTEGGQEVQCGWLTDKYGVSWQISATILDEMLRDPDPVKAQRVMQAMMQMIKIDIAALQAAYNGR